jgi:hypothetical protein
MNEKAWMALIVEHTAAAAKRARDKLGPLDDALQVLSNEVRDDPLASEGVTRALEMPDSAEADNVIGRVELWVQAMKATRK